MSIALVKATNDGFVYRGEELTYALARDSAGEGNATAGLSVGQSKWNNGGTYNYDVRHSFLSVAIPDMITITSCSLFLEGSVAPEGLDYEVYIHTSTYLNPLSNADFVRFAGRQVANPHNGTILNNTWNTSSYSANWNEIVFNAAGLAAVLAAKNNTLGIALISKGDYDNIAPDYNGRAYPGLVSFESSYTAGKEPYLEIIYTTQITESVDVTLEMESSLLAKLKSLISALIEVESDLTYSSGFIRSLEVLVEMESLGIPLLTIPLSSLVGTKTSNSLTLKSVIEPLLEMEATLPTALKTSLNVLVETEITAPAILTFILSALVELETEAGYSSDIIETIEVLLDMIVRHVPRDDRVAQKFCIKRKGNYG